VRSCLQFAIEDSRLRDEAFVAWLTLLDTLHEQDLQGLIDQTFALLVQNWDSLETETQTVAFDAISNLLKIHNKTVVEVIETIPSLANVPLLSKFEAELKRLKDKLDVKRQFDAFARRLQSESIAVVSVALEELFSFLLDNQSFLQLAAISEEPDPIVGVLTRSLLDVCIRFKDVNDEVVVSCGRCLGLIGCNDPSRVEAPREEKQMLVLSNFVVGTETVEFVLFFLQEVLVKVYLTSTVTARQQILAFGMQELLKLCDMASILEQKPGEQYKKWITLHESTRKVLTPFLTSRYVINAPTMLPERKYPIYERRMKYNRWVHDFTLDLLQKGQGDNATLVFSICRRLVRNQDVSIASFLLPYALLNVVVEGNAQQFNDIAQELFTILATPLGGLDSSGRQSLIQCSQVSPL
jgi:serine/threonine-protein kinase ATR